MCSLLLARQRSQQYGMATIYIFIAGILRNWSVVNYMYFTTLEKIRKPIQG
jgi:hypothetical protein